ncbi:hypothetical protein BH24GEM1_BH24GEM1_08750 [soil metagenome]
MGGRVAEEPLSDPAPARRRPLHRAAAEIGARPLPVERPVPSSITVWSHRVPGRAGPWLGDRSLPGRPAARARLGRCHGPVLDGSAGGVRRERDGLRGLRTVRRGPALQPQLSREHRRDPRAQGRVRPRRRRLPNRRMPGQREPGSALRTDVPMDGPRGRGSVLARLAAGPLPSVSGGRRHARPSLVCRGRGSGGRRGSRRASLRAVAGYSARHRVPRLRDRDTGSIADAGGPPDAVDHQRPRTAVSRP